MDKIQGLSSQEAALLLKKNGFNELSNKQQSSWWRLLFNVAKEPMFMMILCCGILYYFLGDPLESSMLLFFVFVLFGMTFYQERKTGKALEALRNLSSPRALVIRDGQEMRIAGREVVVGDVIVVNEGDYVAADAELIASNNLNIDESLLTGESIAVLKRQNDKNKYIYAGTLAVSGKGLAKVFATGNKTEIGKIGGILSEIETSKSPLQAMIVSFVKYAAILSIIVCVVVAIFYSFLFHNVLDGILSGIALAMSILPEEAPMILTVFLALGAWRISKVNVLTRKVPAVEALGSANIICVDKTGTLTMNKMQVEEIYLKGQNNIVSGRIMDEIRAKPEYAEFLHYAVLACQKDPFDPMEKAINTYAKENSAVTNYNFQDWSLIKQYPLTDDLLALSQIWCFDNQYYEVATKGAPEAIFSLCHLTDEEIEKYSAIVKDEASRGLRVLGLAKAQMLPSGIPVQVHDFSFKFLGLIAMADPVRSEVIDSVQKCYQAGIRMLMITGDYPETAKNIAQKVGFKNYDNVLTGAEIRNMTELELSAKIKDVNVFARILPNQKLKIVNALKIAGFVVAMTGDGVNDAAALKSAHIGIAMGKGGTDVAREAADLVLLDDNMSSIVAAIRLGRRIFLNIKKALCYTIAVHIPIIFIAFLPIIFKTPLILMPIHIVFLELIIDPACSIVFEAEDCGDWIMHEPPRPKNTRLIDKKLLMNGVWQGFFTFLIVLLFIIMARHCGMRFAKIRTFVFASLMFTNIALILLNKSDKFAPKMTKARFWHFFHTPAFIMIFGVGLFWLLLLQFNFMLNVFSVSHISYLSLGMAILSGGLVYFVGKIFNRFFKN